MHDRLGTEEEVEEFRRLDVARCVFRLPPRPRDEALTILDRFAALMQRSR